MIIISITDLVTLYMKKSKSKERSRLINDTSSSALDESVIPKTYFASN